MLVNVSYNNKKIIRDIELEVGKSFSWKERWSMGGNGSPKLFVSQASEDISDLLTLDNKINSCNIELRPKGIIVRFRSILETFALVIPYHKLTIFKSGEFSIYRDAQYIKVNSGEKTVQKFFRKVLDAKVLALPVSFQDM